MLIAQAHIIASNIAALLRNPGKTDEKAIMDELNKIKTQRGYILVRSAFGQMRASKHTPFYDLDTWLKMELPEKLFNQVKGYQL